MKKSAFPALAALNLTAFLRTVLLPGAVLSSGAGVLPAQTVSNSSDYVSALTTINSAVTGSTGNSYTVDFNSGLTVTPGTGAFINAGTGNTVSINGHGGTLSGGNTLTPVVIFSGAVKMSDLTIANGFGKGGDGIAGRVANGGVGSGGGGAGLGGGLFIATSAVVTLNNVSFTGNSTQGGFSSYGGDGAYRIPGGNASFVLGLTKVDANGVPTTGAGNAIAGSFSGSLGITGTSAGGQQSLSYIPGKGTAGVSAAGDGSTGSVYDGGATGGSLSLVFSSTTASAILVAGEGKMGGGDGSAWNPGSGLGQYWSAGGGGGLVGGGGAGLEAYGASGGGFGGGGGGALADTGNSGGGGGFGGGGGGGFINVGGAGFGGVAGSSGAVGSIFNSGWGANAGDGIGASLGGGIFVMFGAELKITGSSTFSGNSGTFSYWDGDTEIGALGSDLFVMTGSKTTLAPGAGNTIRFQGTIDDDSTAQRLVEYSDGSYGYVSNGAGARITIGSSSNPGGTVVFEGRTGYAGGTEMMSGTLLLDGNTGSIKSGSDLIFSGQSEFRYDNTHSSGSAAKTQTFGTLAFQGSDGTVTNIKGNALSSTLGFSTITRATGATGNFVAADGTNGSTNQILIGGIAGFRSPGLFFGGNDYAVVDGGGYVRGINYGVDADSILSSGGATIGGSPDASSHVKLSGAITAQTTATLATLNLDSHNLTLGSGQTLAVNGLLQSGGAATIGGGNGITYAGFGTETDLVIRTDKASDTLTIGNALSAPNLTKSGEGILVLSGTNSIAGATALNAGTLRVNGSLTATAVTVASGATLAGSGTIGGATEFLSGGILAPGNSPGTLTFTDGVTFDAGAILDFELGTASDLIRVSGGTLTGPTSGTITLNFSDSGGFTAASYTLVDFSGATTSSFDASDFTLGSTIGGYTYQLSLAGSTLQLVATASAVPEPATYAALFGLAALGLVARRRRSARTAALSPNR